MDLTDSPHPHFREYQPVVVVAPDSWASGKRGYISDRQKLRRKERGGRVGDGWLYFVRFDDEARRYPALAGELEAG